MKTERRRNQGGFTLIEILVVVVIVGVLATLVVQNLSGTQEQANLSATKHDIDVIEQCAQRYKMANNKWPESIDEIITTDDSTMGYLDEAPIDKWNGVPYTLERSGLGVIVTCAGFDGEVGTDDDITSENYKKLKISEYLEIIKQK